MSKYSDPLGIERTVSEYETLHALNPISEDLAEDWNNHPITKRLKQTLQIELYKRQSEWLTPINQELYSCIRQILDYPILEEEK